MNVSIRTIITSITIRDLEAEKHETNKYAIVSMYFEGTDAFDIVVKAILIRKIHLIKNLKVNLLIKNDIFESKFIDIFIFINTAYIDNCDDTISITINVKSRSRHMLIHALKTTTIFVEIECVLQIHNTVLSERNYLFEAITKVNFFIYAHMINSQIKFILIRNKDKSILRISRNFRLKTLN